MAAELVNPDTGEVVDPADVDALAAGFLRAKEAAEAMRTLQHRFGLALAALARGEARTRRVRGDHVRVKVEMPPDSFDQGVLKELWSHYPAFARTFIAVERLKVKMAEYKKAANESGPPEFEDFKRALLAANRGPQGLPAVTVEEVGEGETTDE